MQAQAADCAPQLLQQAASSSQAHVRNLANSGRPQQLWRTGAGLAGAVEQDALVGQRGAGGAQRRQHARQANAGGALQVRVMEGASRWRGKHEG